MGKRNNNKVAKTVYIKIKGADEYIKRLDNINKLIKQIKKEYKAIKKIKTAIQYET